MISCPHMGSSLHIGDVGLATSAPRTGGLQIGQAMEAAWQLSRPPSRSTVVAGIGNAEAARIVGGSFFWHRYPPSRCAGHFAVHAPHLAVPVSRRFRPPYLLDRARLEALVDWVT